MTRQHDQEGGGMSAQTQQDAQQNTPEEIEVEFKPGADVDAAAAAEYDQKPPEEKAPEEPKQNDADVLDTIVPSKDPKVWTIGPPDMQRTYVQKEMSFLGKMQWFSLVGEALDKALSGPNGLSLNSLFSMPGASRGVFRMEDFRDADMFVAAISKLLSAMPNFLLRSYMIWLNVPDYDAEIVENLMKLPPDEGGLSDEQGLEIIEVFLDQNYNALADFFGKRLGQLQARISKLNEERASQR
jgi:hypothetical protein